MLSLADLPWGIEYAIALSGISTSRIPSQICPVLRTGGFATLHSKATALVLKDEFHSRFKNGLVRTEPSCLQARLRLMS